MQFRPADLQNRATTIDKVLRYYGQRTGMIGQ